MLAKTCENAMALQMWVINHIHRSKPFSVSEKWEEDSEQEMDRDPPTSSDEDRGLVETTGPHSLYTVTLSKVKVLACGRREDNSCHSGQRGTL